VSSPTDIRWLFATVRAQLDELERQVAALPLADEPELDRPRCSRCGITRPSEQALAEHLANVHGVDLPARDEAVAADVELAEAADAEQAARAAEMVA
jgi:hypothetical protein